MPESERNFPKPIDAGDDTMAGHRRCRFMFGPTPLHPLPGLSRRLGVELWMKRDDLTELGGGGNKVRKLEFLMAQAIAADSDVVLTAGSPQSNHCRLTAAAAARCNLPCEVLTVPPEGRFASEYDKSGNRLLFDGFGALVHGLPPGTDSVPALEARAEELTAKGRRPFVIPIGGSTAVGSLGYVLAAVEVAEQCVELDVTFDLAIVATGSGGMQAGLVVGRTLRPFAERLLGMSVGRGEGEQCDRVSGIAHECAELLDVGLDEGSVEVSACGRGPGYGRADASTSAAVTSAARLDGVILDPVYTGKALAGLLAMADAGELPRGGRVLFWHSGGVPALFAYPDIFELGESHAD